MLPPPTRGTFIVAFEDKRQMERKSLDGDVFNFHTPSEVESLLRQTGYLNRVGIESRTRGRSSYHIVAVK
jgi:hypothetical protein